MTDPDTARAQLLGPIQVRELAEELDISPTKKLGQNFVNDPNTAVSYTHLRAHETVLDLVCRLLL